MGVMREIGLKGHGETCSGTSSVLYPQTLGLCLPWYSKYLLNATECPKTEHDFP